jgi:hypothetical protein
MIRDDISAVTEQVFAVQKETEDVKAEMARYDDPAHKQSVTKAFRELMHGYLFDLEVHTLASDKLRVHSNISETGSDLPRALLAYYYSILALMKRNSTSAFCPIVIDSPNQQDQDLANLKKMLTFIRDKRPEGSQVVLGLVDDCDVEFEGSIIELNDKYRLLQEKDYPSISADVHDLLEKVRKAGFSD